MAGKVKNLQFSEGVTVTAPAQNFITASSLSVHASDAAYVTAKGSAAEEGDVYFNSTTNVVKQHDGSAWADVGAGLPRALETVTGTTHTLDDNDDIIVLDASSNAITVNLHAVASAKIKPYTFIVKDNTNTITLDPNSSETINGETTWTLPNKYQAIDVIPDGSAWYIKSKGQNAPDMSCTFARCIASGQNGGSLSSSSYQDSQFSHYQGDDMFTSGPITAGTLSAHTADSHSALGTWNLIPGKTSGNAFTTFDFAPGIYRLKFSKGTGRKGCKVRIYDNDGAAALRYGNTAMVVSDTNSTAWSTVEINLVLTTANEYSFEYFIGGGGTSNANARGVPLGDGVCETFATVDVEYWKL